VSRILTVGAAQLGPIARAETRAEVVRRMVALLDRAKARGCRLVVFPELALTTFFPRWFMPDQAEVDIFFEREMPSAETRPLFEAARRHGIGFYLGYAELTPEGRRFNTSILVDEQGREVGKYRKVHLPGHAEHEPQRPWQHLEKRYFEVGDLGFPVWRMMGGAMGMCICNDRRWPETFRVMGLQGVELVMLGYNTPRHLHRAAFGRDRRQGVDPRRRADRLRLRPRPGEDGQGDDLRLRPPPPCRALWNHHRPDRRHRAAGLRPSNRHRSGISDRRNEGAF
jgi:predicted amidohydrolase